MFSFLKWLTQCNNITDEREIIMTFSYIQHVNDFNMLFVESSVVKLTPEAFLNPTAYLDTAETKSSVKMMTDFISGDRSTNPGLKVIGFLWFFP